MMDYVMTFFSAVGAITCGLLVAGAIAQLTGLAKFNFTIRWEE